MQKNLASLLPKISSAEPNLSTPIWTQINSPNFTPRYNHTSIAIDHYIITFGGNNGQNYLNDVLIFDTHENICQEFTILNIPPQARAFHSMCKISDDQIIIYGGYSGSQVLGDFHIMKITSFEPPIGEWMDVNSNGFSLKRYGHSAHVYHNQMYVIAGCDEKLEPTRDIWCLNLGNFESFSWSQCKIHTKKPNVRGYHSSMICGEMIYMFGGGMDRQFSMSDFWRYDIEWMRWQKLENLQNYPPPSGRRNHSMQEIGGNIYVFGGRESSHGPKSDSLYCYNIAGQRWDQLKPREGTLGLTKYGHTHVCVEGKMYILGGRNRTILGSSEIWMLEIDDGKKGKSGEESAERKGMEIETTRKRDDEDCDVAFEVEGEIFRAHKEILEARCKYFYHMFASNGCLGRVYNIYKGGMMESKMEIIKITEVKSSVFNMILKYIYEGKVELDEELAVDLLGISDQYLLKDLRKSCEKYLMNCLKKETLAKRIEQAEHFGAELLREGALRFLADNLEEVSQYPGRDEISKEILVEVILGLQQKMIRK